MKTIEKAAVKSRAKAKHADSLSTNSVHTELVEGFTKLSNVVDSRVSQAGPQGRNDFVYVDIGSIDNEKKLIESPKTLSVDEAPSRAKQLLEVGDVVVSMTRPNLNAIAQITSELASSIGSTGFDVLRANRKLAAPTWIYYNLQTSRFISEMSALVQGALYPAVRSKDIRNFEIWLPPVPTQHRIVAEIEEKLSRLDAAQSALLRAQANLKRYRASILEAMVTIASADKKSAHTKCEAVCFFITKGTTPAKEMMQCESTEIPFLKVYNLTSDSTLNNEHKPTFVSIKTHQGDLARSKVVPGDVLMNIVGPPLGQVSIVPESLPEANINQAIARFRPLKTISTKFLAYWLLTPSTVRWTISQAKATVGQLNLTLEICRNIPLALPPLKIQQEIVDEVERRLSVIDRTEQTLRTQLERAKRLRQSILQQAFSPLIEIQ